MVEQTVGAQASETTELKSLFDGSWHLAGTRASFWQPAL